MRRTVWAGAGLMALAACSGSSDAVGENSAGSIRTTAVGNVVAAEPSPAPTANLAIDNAISADADENMAASADAMTSNAAQ